MMMMMMMRSVCAAALCLAVLLHYGSSARVFPGDKGFAEKESANEILVDDLYIENHSQSRTLPPIEIPKEESDSSESVDEESNLQVYVTTKTFNSESSDEDSNESTKTNSYHKSYLPNRNKRVEDSSSEESSSNSETKDDIDTVKDLGFEELKQARLIKRSLSSEIDSLNAIDKNTDLAKTKDGDGTDNNGNITIETVTYNSGTTEPVKDTSGDEDATKPTVEGETSTITVVDETSQPTDATEPTQSETETTTEAETVTTTSKEEETKNQTEEETTERELRPTTEPTTEFEVTPTTEPAETDNSNSETDDGPSAGTTNSTEIESENSDENRKPTFTEAAMARVNKLSDQIRLVLSQYRKTHAVVIPGQNFFPDPMPLQDFQSSFSVGTMTFKTMHVYGLSNFTVEHVNTDVDRMQVYVMLHMKRLVILGNYTLKSFFSRAAGPFNVTLLDVDSEGVAEVATAEEGHLEATDSDMDMNTRDMKVDFKNMGFYGSLFQSAASSVGDVIFNSIKPQLLEKVNVIIRNDVNVKLKEFSTKFINKVAPVDAAVSEGRRYVKTHGYDPYHIKDHTFLLGGLVYVNITEFLLEGLSKFYRVGNLSLSMDKGTIEVGVHVATEQLTGHCSWSGQALGFYTKSKKTNFTVHHLQVRALVTQSLDIREKPKLADLDLELGWVKVTMDTPTSLHYMIQGVINAFPRLIRHIIVDTLEQPLREKIQEILNEINVESVVDEHLPKLDTFGL